MVIFNFSTRLLSTFVNEPPFISCWIRLCKASLQLVDVWIVQPSFYHALFGKKVEEILSCHTEEGGKGTISQPKNLSDVSFNPSHLKHLPFTSTYYRPHKKEICIARGWYRKWCAGGKKLPPHEQWLVWNTDKIKCPFLSKIPYKACTCMTQSNTFSYCNEGLFPPPDCKK